MRRAFVGFDSAWGGKAKGGICAAIFDNGRLERFSTPEPASFDHATATIEQIRQEADYTLVAIDQPTMVPNAEGMRPVEKVAGALKTGVQPAFLRSKMWWSSAPIWTFLDQLSPNEDPRRARTGSRRVARHRSVPRACAVSFRRCASPPDQEQGLPLQPKKQQLRSGGLEPRDQRRAQAGEASWTCAFRRLGATDVRTRRTAAFEGRPRRS